MGGKELLECILFKDEELKACANEGRDCVVCCAAICGRRGLKPREEKS
jgi:hypothetical protein